MCDEWMTGLRLPLTAGEFHQLPRNPAYRYEHAEGVGSLSPRPRFYHAVLDLDPAPVPTGADASAVLRPLADADWDELPAIFAMAFRELPPFGHLEDAPRREAARKSLTRTRTGGDGPLIDRACFVAVGADDRPRGAILVTLLPDADPADPGSFHWDEPPPADALAQRFGRPHLTWVFVAPPWGASGLGATLLRAATDAVRGLGYSRLASTFLLGNHASTMWHWQMGFRLADHPLSRRRTNELRIK